MFVCGLTGRPDGEAGNETAVVAVGASRSFTQLPESHSGGSAAALTGRKYFRMGNVKQNLK